VDVVDKVKTQSKHNVPVDSLDQYEVRFLRKCVRYELKLRGNKPWPGYEVKQERGEYLRRLAKTFVTKNY
jgi:hypothetical protein